jgi:tRNA-dihydrouridine synthase 1
MVHQSELPWRMLCRKYGAELCYTPMINSAQFTLKNEKYREQNFRTCKEDRPLIVQFCANDPATLLHAAELVQDECDAVDINLGCPQQIAKRGHYGSFLQDEWDLISSMGNNCLLNITLVRILNENLKIPVTCKIRIFPDVERTVQYSRMLESSGCSLLTVHGRTREQNGQLTGLADWEQIRRVKESVSIPVIANGNILYHEDIDKCMEVTKCDGVMVAETNLANPGIFCDKQFFIPDLVDEYLELCEKYPVPELYIRPHLFRMYRHSIEKHKELRDELAQSKTFQDMKAVASKFRKALENDREAESDPDVACGLKFSVNEQGIRDYPSYICQPYVRPSKEAELNKRKDDPDRIQQISKKMKPCENIILKQY